MNYLSFQGKLFGNLHHPLNHECSHFPVKVRLAVLNVSRADSIQVLSWIKIKQCLGSINTINLIHSRYKFIYHFLMVNKFRMIRNFFLTFLNCMMHLLCFRVSGKLTNNSLAWGWGRLFSVWNLLIALKIKAIRILIALLMHNLFLLTVKEAHIFI